MSNNIEIKYPKDSFKNYQKEILCQNELGLFFKMSFINLKMYIMAIVDTGDFESIGNIKVISPHLILKLVADLIDNMFEMENRYLYLGEYKIDARYIMYSRSEKKVRMLYVPYVYSSKQEILCDIKNLIIDMSKGMPINKNKRKVLNNALEFIDISGNDLKLISCKFKNTYFSTSR